MEGEIMNQRVGRSSIRLAQPVCVVAGASIVGKKEGEGPLGALFDMVGTEIFSSSLREMMSVRLRERRCQLV